MIDDGENTRSNFDWLKNLSSDELLQMGIENVYSSIDRCSYDMARMNIYLMKELKCDPAKVGELERYVEEAIDSVNVDDFDEALQKGEYHRALGVLNIFCERYGRENNEYVRMRECLLPHLDAGQRIMLAMIAGIWKEPSIRSVPQ